MAQDIEMSACESDGWSTITYLRMTYLNHHDGLAQHFVQTFIIPRAWILLTLLIP